MKKDYSQDYGNIELRKMVPGIEAKEYHVSPNGLSVLNLALFLVAKQVNELFQKDIFNYESIFDDVFPLSDHYGVFNSIEELQSAINEMVNDNLEKFTAYITSHMEICDAGVLVNIVNMQQINDQILMNNIYKLSEDGTYSYDLTTIPINVTAPLIPGQESTEDCEVIWDPNFLKYNPEYSPIGQYWVDKVIEFKNNLIQFMIQLNQVQQQNTGCTCGGNCTCGHQHNTATPQQAPIQQEPIQLVSWTNIEPTQKNVEKIDVTNTFNNFTQVPDTYEECTPEQKNIVDTLVQNLFLHDQMKKNPHMYEDQLKAAQAQLASN